MPSEKEEILEMLKNLPDELTLEEVQYHLHVRQKIKEGLEQIEQGKTIPHEEVKERMKKWTEEKTYKQYLIVIKPKIEHVSKAKFGVHCAHASISAALDAYNNDRPRFLWWYDGGKLQTKILKEVKTFQKLENLIKKAIEHKLPNAMIADAGFTSELEEGEYIMGCVGPITEEEAREMGIWRLGNFK